MFKSKPILLSSENVAVERARGIFLLLQMNHTNYYSVNTIFLGTLVN